MTTSSSLIAPRRVFLALSLVGAGGLAVIGLLGRTSAGWRSPAAPAAIALVVAIVLSALLARMWNDERYVRVQTVLLVALSTLSAPIAWFFGASSAFAGVIALLLVLVGLLGGGPVEAPRPAIGAWLVYATIATSQAVVATLGLAGVLPDESLQPLMPPGHALWEHAASNAMLQGVYLAAFITGRVFRRRYAHVASELAASLRTAATRGALLEEAREGFQQALAAGRRGLFSGQTLGTYVVGELIGRGGHGEVYEGRDTRDDRNVAIKILRGDRMSATGEVRRFLAEGEAARRVDSPHVPQIFHAAGLEAAVPFIAMERLVGPDLHTKAQHGPLARSELVELVEHATAALEAVHASGQLHGDVHPLNLIATPSGWKLIDFGASAAPEHGGLPRYAAPEKRSQGALPTRQSDLYELAACLYLAITGHAPFSDLTDEPLARAVVHEAPVDPRQLATVSDDVAAALALGLCKQPDARPADAAELRRWFLAALDGNLAASLRTRAAALAWSEQRTHVAPVAATTEPSISVEAVPAVTAPSAPTIADAHREAAWKQAYLDRVKRQRALVLVLCVSGGLLLALITTSPAAMWFSLACIAAMALALTVLPVAAAGTWTLISILSVGPAFAVGLHSGFAAIVALVVFLGGLFDPRDPQGSWWKAHSSTIVIVGVHTAAFAAVTLGLVPDAGNMPVRYALAPPGAGILLHGAVIGTYIASHVSAMTIHARYDALVRRNELATRAAIQQEALLATARAELERVAAGDVGGVLTNARIGSYRVGRLLGRGGMGEVYEVTRDTQRYALKVIRGDRLASATSARRFAREATTLQRVDSPYVARVIEVGSDPTLPFLVMELVEGPTLSELLRAHGALAAAQVRGLIRDLARGLDDVHRAGVVHRDIKPGNIVRTTRGDAHRWMLIDFGIARLLDTPTESTGNTLLGTPAFMAPELVAGRSADQRTDTFALGVVAYRALTGRSTWTIPEALAPRRPEPRDPCADTAVAADVGLALRIALAPDPDQRFASAAELAAAFESAFDGALDERVRRRAEDILAAHPWRD